MNWHKPVNRRWIAAAMFGWFLIVPIAAFVFAIPPVSADEGTSSLGTATAEVALKACTGAAPGLSGDPCEGAGEALETTDQKILKPALEVALLTALLNVVQFTLDRVAYEAAVAIASGGEGESPLFFSEEPSEAWKDFGLDIAGDAIDQLNDVVNESLNIDFDICDPGALIKFALSLGIKQAYQPEEPDCSVQDIRDNWDAFIQTTVDTASNPSEAVLQTFAEGLKPGRNELSASIGLTIAVHEQVLQAKTQKLAEQLANGGFKNVTDIVTGKVETPSSVLSTQFNDELESARKEKREVSINTVINNSHLVSQLFRQVAGVFTNTLLSTLFTRIYDGLFDVEPPSNPFEEFSAGTAGLEEAQARFASLITTNPVTISDYNAIAEFVTCSSGGVTVRNINNCVMDSNFASAVTRAESGTALTVQEAIDEGLLNGDWPLISNQDLARNGDPLCYTYGFCYGNLVKLRKARIVPIGWEIAASRNDTSNPQTLQEIVDDFDNCNDHGTVDADTHKFCHLIDPNWILTYPQTQCLAYVNGEILISTLSGGRNGYCADTPSCISEDNDGNCNGGYGYCVREKNVWRFRGDECPEYYASCLSFENTFTGENADYLVSTVDYSVCNAQNAGCRWYRTNKYLDDGGTADDASDDTYSFLPFGDTYDTADREDDWSYDGSTRDTFSYTSSSGTTYDYDTYSYEDRIYYNNNVTECGESEAGCTKLFAVNDELVLNAIANGSFEDDDDNNGIPDFWNWETASETYETTGGAYYGSDSIVTGASDGITQENIALTSNAFYTFSFYAEAVDSGASVEGLLKFFDDDGTAIDFTGTSYDESEDCTRVFSDRRYKVTGSPDTAEWTRYECTFTTTSDPTHATVTLSATGGDVRVDGIMFEQGEDATIFTDGYNTSDPTASYLIVAPDYLHCTGAATDPAECDDYTQACTAQDVGCNLYTPEDGDPSVPAIAGTLDECPSECVGYTTYKQEATLYDDEEFPLYFIADNAVSCSEENVGCDSFTNVDAVSEGGEGIEYYTYLRACLTSEDAGSDSATFFTWEGSDAAGYQLKTWQLLQSNFLVVDTVNYTEASGDDDSEANKAPCVNWEVSSVSGSLTITCDDRTIKSDLEADDDCNEHDDIFNEPDCREFYDADGNIHYRRFSDTVTISDDCHPYRKTDSTESDCDASAGYWTDTGECAYFGLVEESTSCPSSADGCREYTGGAGRNATTAFEDTFEDGDVAGYITNGTAAIDLSNESVATNGHSMRMTLGSGDSVTTLQSYLDWSDKTLTYDASDATTCDQSNETIVGGGCDVDVDGDGTADCTVEPGDNSCGTLDDELVAGKTYILSFWAKGDVDLGITFVEEGGSGDTHDFGDPIELSGSWQLYEVGPLDTASFDAFDDTAIISFYNASSSTGTIYLDNVKLKAAEENITLIKDSWYVPASCDTSPAGTSAPQYYLGCEAYTDQDGNDGTFYQFSDLCSEDVVGCEAFYDTQNSDSEYGQAYNVRCMYDTDGDVTDGETASSNTACALEGETVCTVEVGRAYCLFDASSALPIPLPSNIVLGPEAVVVPNDTVTYLVDDGSTTCEAASMGCQEVGNPTFSQDRTEVTEFESVYYINLPDSYGDVLCDNEALFCEEWSSTQDGNFYFKDPESQTCEYQSSVTINNQDYFGWFRTDSSDPCYWTDTDGDGAFDPTVDDSYLISGEELGIWRNGDTAYDGWVGQCSSAYDLCTEFVDAVDTSEGLYPQGTSYFFVNDDLMSEETLSDDERCNGQISQKEGCALFRSVNNSELTYATEPSYIVSEHADYFFGDAPLSLQDPIDCDTEAGGEITLPGTSTVVDVCEQRCRYNTGSSVELAIGNAVRGVNGINEFASACVTDDDCPVLKGDDGEDYEGDCYDLVGTVNEDNARFDNDANEIIKVNRDRECAEWLYEDSGPYSWNTKTNRYEIISDGVGLCSQYAVAGDQTNCTQNEEQDPIVLDVFEYANRDVSWNGLEYSGYAIPNQLPVEHYDQMNINPDSWCVGASGDPVTSGEEYVPCSSDSDCTPYGAANTCESADQDLRLGYIAGPCDQDVSGFGGSCTIGACSDSGLDCSSDDDCDSGEDCVIGYCQDLSTTACSSDAECTDSAFPDCDPQQGVCVDALTPNANTCVDVTDCGSGAGTETCTPAALSKTGSCFNDQCLTDIAGEPFDKTGALARTLECRGYPEPTSPFTPDLVEAWQTVTVSSGTVSTDFFSLGESSVPYTLKYGFQGVDVCAPAPIDSDGDGTTDSWEANDDCLCNYDKAEYLEGAAVRYYPQATSNALIPEGICISGAAAGATCSSDEECQTGDTLGGTCAKLTRQDSLFGFEGYCLEKDSSIYLFGSTDTEDHPCLTWLPVDQPAGSTDLYAKYTEAGYPLTESYYCGEVGYYENVRTSNYTKLEDETDLTVEGNIACAEFEGNCKDGNDIDPCLDNFYCPTGYFAIMGACAFDKNDKTTSYAQACRQGTFKDNDCPYICVPKNSVHEDDTAGVQGEPCEAPSGSSGHGDTSDGYATDVYWYSGAKGTDFDDVVPDYLDCVNGGVAQDNPDFEEWYHSSIRNLELHVSEYAACSSLIQVASSDESDATAVWTNRVWADGSYTIIPDTYSSYLAYSYDTITIWFGQALSPILDESTVALGGTDNRPFTVRQCRDSDNYDLPFMPQLTESCDNEPYDGSEGQAYHYWETSTEGSTTGSECIDDSDCTDLVNCSNSSGICLQPCTTDSDCTNVDDNDTNTVDLGDCMDETGYCEETFDAGDESECEDAGSDLEWHTGVCDSGPNLGTTCNVDSDCYDGVYCVEGHAGGTNEPDTDSYCNGIEPPPPTEFDTGSDLVPSDVKDRLSQIFARSLYLFEFDDAQDGIGTNSIGEALDMGHGEYDGPSALGSSWDWDVTATGDDNDPGDDKPEPPIVAALGACTGTQCEEGSEDTITVNGVDSGTIVGSGGSEHVVVSFFAYADNNQMPIKNIIVDWGDGDWESTGADWPTDSQSGSDTDDNYYKNHRGLLIGRDSATYCDDSEWGRTSDSCDSSYISFTHDYVCGSGTYDDLASDSSRQCAYGDNGQLLNSPCTGGVTGASDDCVFQPRVFVKDNWGWCTGVCPGGIDGTDGCYDGEDLSGGNNECDQKLCPGDSSCFDADPWVYFDGYVTVEP